MDGVTDDNDGKLDPYDSPTANAGETKIRSNGVQDQMSKVCCKTHLWSFNPEAIDRRCSCALGVAHTRFFSPSRRIM